MSVLHKFFQPNPIRKIFWLGLIGLTVVILFVLGWYYSYRFTHIISLDSTPLMEPQTIEGYPGQFHYDTHDTAQFHIRSTSANGNGVLRRITKPYHYDTFNSFSFDRIKQPIPSNPSVKGCQWDPVLNLPLSDTMPTGFYNLQLKNKQDTSNITFLVNKPRKNPEVAILAPVTTWVAYNQWGGKSLYYNGIDSTKVYQVATNRPNTALNYSRKRRQQSIHLQANIFHWFDKRYKTSLLPDYSLENPSKRLKQADMIVLAYHCEYFSKPMYDNLQNLVREENISLISMGANQVYWKVRWHANYSQLECHKDLTFFDNSLSLGGMWRHNLRPEANFLGGQYTPPGMGTYAPYQVKKPDHWLFKGASVKKGDLFGQEGINKYPLSGDETDKTTWLSQWGTKVIAKGMNPGKIKDRVIYREKRGNPAGGAALTFRKVNTETGILNTGSIQSGSGLGTDTIFTTIIKNFNQAYIP